MLPFGAREKRTAFPDAPSRFYSSEGPAAGPEELKAAAKKKRDLQRKQSTWGEKVLKELEAFFPQVKPFRELYSGGKFVQVQFKSTPSFCLGVLPASSALLAAAGNFAVGFLLRCLAVWRPFVARPEAESLFSYEPLQGPVASVVLFFWGLLACVLVRNR
jgi:hypothetical protein